LEWEWIFLQSGTLYTLDPREQYVSIFKKLGEQVEMGNIQKLSSIIITGILEKTNKGSRMK
jgi:hypothetical protein